MITSIKEEEYSKIPDVYAEGFSEKPWANDWYAIDQFDPKTMWVYKERNEIIGFVISFISRGVPYVSVLTVVQSKQNNHIGEALMSYAFDYWYKAYDAVYLHVDFDNPRASRFYKRLGFKVEETRNEDYYMIRIKQ